MQNCWEYKNCGREPGGKNVEGKGICPAAIQTKVDEIHGGKNAGRCCWAIAGTFCDGEIQADIREKQDNCLKCSFYQSVWHEEQHKGYMTTSMILDILKN